MKRNVLLLYKNSFIVGLKKQLTVPDFFPISGKRKKNVFNKYLEKNPIIDSKKELLILFFRRVIWSCWLIKELLKPCVEVNNVT